MLTKIIDPTTIISLIDLTSLNENDNDESILNLCQNAMTTLGSVAAVCIYPQFVELAVELLKNTHIKIATVVNFPQGTSSLSKIQQEITHALHHHANEIDIVFPYLTYLNGDEEKALELIASARKLCKNNIKLKVIIETGELKSLEIIHRISEQLIDLGVDFIKTSTGKTEQGASLEAVKVILNAISKKTNIHPHHTGIKISGGIRTISQATSYIHLANEIMGENWVTPGTFRIGASQLLKEILLMAKKPAIR